MRSGDNPVDSSQLHHLPVTLQQSTPPLQPAHATGPQHPVVSIQQHLPHPSRVHRPIEMLSQKLQPESRLYLSSVPTFQNPVPPTPSHQKFGIYWKTETSRPARFTYSTAIPLRVSSISAGPQGPSGALSSLGPSADTHQICCSAWTVSRTPSAPRLSRSTS
jgi:hypothetical protein